MKLPLRFGIPLLVLLWLAGGYTTYGQGKTLLVVLAMGVAMWTAFSLPHPGRKAGAPPEDDEDPALEDDFTRLIEPGPGDPPRPQLPPEDGEPRRG